MFYHDLLPEIGALQRRAGAAILEVYESADFRVETKTDASPVTAADFAANAIIVEGLLALSPALPVISEETSLLPYETRRQFEYCWMVDPLDGTKEFIRRNGEFTINIALIHRDRPVLGAVYVPCTGEWCYAALGLGAYRLHDGRPERLRAASFRMDQPGLVVPCSRSHLDDATRAIIATLRQPVLVPAGSALKFLRIAAGEAHFYPRVGPTSEWDTAAAQIILEEAGGQLLRLDDGQPLSYNKPALLNPPFMAMGKKTG